MERPIFYDESIYQGCEIIYKTAEGESIFLLKAGDYYTLADKCSELYVWSEECIVNLELDRFLCKQDDRYGIVNLEGEIIVPFVYDKLEKRNEAYCKGRYNVLQGERWGVIDISGKEIFRIKYKEAIPTIEQLNEAQKKCSLSCLPNVFHLNGKTHILVEDGVTGRKGLVNFDGLEIVPAIYVDIKPCECRDFVYVSFSSGVDNSTWGCYNAQGKEIIPIKYYNIHYLENYFIAGVDFYDYTYFGKDDLYYGEYDLYDSEGKMLIGGFNNCEINISCFIFRFGITPFYSFDNYGEKITNLNFENMISVLVDKKLKTLVPIHYSRLNQTEIEDEVFLHNNFLNLTGKFIDNYPSLLSGKRYSIKDVDIRRIGIWDGCFFNDNIFAYWRNNSEREFLSGIIFCKERRFISARYVRIKAINNILVFIQEKDNSFVGIRNHEKILINDFDVIIYPNDNKSLGFKWDMSHCVYLCFLLDFTENSIQQTYIANIEYEALCQILHSSNVEYWDAVEFVIESKQIEEYKSFVKSYWTKIYQDKKHFWFPSNFDLINDDEGELEYDSEECDLRSSDYKWWEDTLNWEYYNEDLDMDQQDERFWE